MKRVQSISFIASILVVLCYLGFSALSFMRYPLPYSPIKNWLSDLGSIDLNPKGAMLYNIGVIFTAMFLMLFFLGLSRLKIGNKRVQTIMLYLTQVCGLLGAFCMLMSAVFPINFFQTHSFWSTAMYILLSTSFVFLAAALRYYPTVPRGLLIMGILTAILVNLTNFLRTAYVLEWITTLLFLAFVSLVGIEMKRLESGPQTIMQG